VLPLCFPKQTQPMKHKLTQQIVNTLTLAKDRDEEFVWDTDLEGFGVRLRRSAGGVRKSFVSQYRLHGRTRREKLGDRLTLAQARAEARRILARVELGHDLKAEKNAKRAQAARTFAAAVELYLANKARRWRPGTLRQNRLYLTGRYFKPLHSVPLAEISRAYIAARFSAIINEHGDGTAVAARRSVSALLAWAMQEGWIESNPTIGTRKPAIPASRDRVLSNEELAAIWRASDPITRLLILTGARRQEVGGLCWSELVLETGTWTLPAARSKNHRAHTIALPSAALTIINAVPRTERDHLFGERAKAGFVTWSRHKRALDQRLGDSVAPWRLHDLRRTVATGMADIGIEPHIIEACLNHHGGHRRGVAGVYNRSPYEQAVKIAFARWADHVLALVEGREGKIVTLRA
jgi:integrase